MVDDSQGCAGSSPVLTTKNKILMKTHIKTSITFLIIIGIFIWGHFNEKLFLYIISGIAIIASLLVVYFLLYTFFEE